MGIYLVTLALIIGGGADWFFLHDGHGLIAFAIGVAISSLMTARAVNRARA